VSKFGSRHPKIRICRQDAILTPHTTSGKLVARLPAGGGHWNSPIVIDGRIGLPEGDANDHRTSGVLAIFRLP
jgi:hypothetical protein